MESAEALKFVHHLKNDVINQKNPEAASKYFAEDFVSLNAIPGRQPGLVGLRVALNEFFEAFPDIRETVEEVVADGDRIAVVSTIKATHGGAFMGVQPTGNRIYLHIFELYHMKGAKVGAAWVFFDALAYLGQVGALPGASGAPTD